MLEARSTLLAGLLVVAALAGCIGGDDTPPTRTVSASGGLASDGYAYDGQGLVSASATLEGQVDVDEDTGLLNVSFEAWNSTWTVTYGTFSGQEDFKEGGIVADLTEHGDSGVSTPEIPTIRGELVTYGSAEVLRDGAPYSIGDGSGDWSSHLMLSQDSVRGSDGLIAKSDNSTPYDPSTPGDARIIEDDRQGLLKLVAPSGEDAGRAPTDISEMFSFAGPNNTESVELATAPYASATLQVSTTATQGAISIGQIEVTIVDQNGTELASGGGQVTPNQGYNETFSLQDLDGPVTVEVSGDGGYDVNIAGQITYDDHPFIVVTWDDYTLEPS